MSSTRKNQSIAIKNLFLEFPSALSTYQNNPYPIEAEKRPKKEDQAGCPKATIKIERKKIKTLKKEKFSLKYSKFVFEILILVNYP